MREGILTIEQQVLTAPDPASDLMPVNTDSFWEGLLEILTEALPQIMPSMSECLNVCLSVLAVVLLLSILETLPGNSKRAADLAGCAAIGMLLLRPANSLIQLGVEMIQSVSEYCKLLLPVMTAALAGSGGTTTSAALYAGTAVFDALLTSLISNLIIPILYVFLCFSILNSALGNDTLKKLSGFMKWLAT
jgi:stage III sporulation protein AE